MEVVQPHFVKRFIYQQLLSAHAQYDHAGEPHPCTKLQLIVAIDRQHSARQLNSVNDLSFQASFFGLYYPSSGAATWDISGKQQFLDGTHDRASKSGSSGIDLVELCGLETFVVTPTSVHTSCSKTKSISHLRVVQSCYEQSTSQPNTILAVDTFVAIVLTYIQQLQKLINSYIEQPY